MAAVYAPRFVSNLMLGLALALAAALVKLPRRLGVIGAVVLIGANLLTFQQRRFRCACRTAICIINFRRRRSRATSLFNTPMQQFDTYL